MLTSTFHCTAADEIALLAKTGIIHTFLVMGEIRDGGMDSFCCSGDRSEQLAVMDQSIDLAFP